MAARGQADAARHRVQRGEQPVLHQDVGAGERPHQGALARVRVADERDDGQALTGPLPPVQRPLLPHLLDLPLERRYAVADQPPVRLQLRLARAARADPPLQPLQVGPLAAQPRQDVLVLGQLHLEPALPRPRVLGEDVQDERRAVQHLHLEGLLQRALLGRRELIVEDDGRVGEGVPLGGDLLHLAAADVGGRARAGQPLHRLADDARPGGVRQQRQLLQRALRRPAVLPAVDTRRDQERPLFRVRCGMQPSRYLRRPPPTSISRVLQCLPPAHALARRAAHAAPRLSSRDAPPHLLTHRL